MRDLRKEPAAGVLGRLIARILISCLLADSTLGVQTTNICVRTYPGGPCLPRCPRCLIGKNRIYGNCKSGGLMFTCKTRRNVVTFRSFGLVAPGPAEPELSAEELAQVGLSIESSSDWDPNGPSEPLPTLNNLRECSPMAGMPIDIYQHFNLGGSVCSLQLDTPRLDADFDNQASGCVVNEGTWMLYSEFDFQGEVSILEPGTYQYPWTMGITNDLLSSARPFPVATATSILLFQDYDFKGRMVHITAAAEDLRAIGFNDLASSAIVLTGTWRMHQHINYFGASYDLAPGRYARLTPHNDLSSLRPI